jgi:hypothetical protein
VTLVGEHHDFCENLPFAQWGPVADLGIGDIRSRAGQHLAGGGTGRLHKKNRPVFYRSFSHHVYDIMSPCGTYESVNLVGVGALVLVCELGRSPTQKYKRGRRAGVG